MAVDRNLKMTNPLCPICQAPLIISEWEGWIWYCYHCEHEDRQATNEEIEELEKEREQIINQTLKNIKKKQNATI